MKERMFKFTPDQPPTEDEFNHIGDILLEDLRQFSQLNFREIKRHTEPKSWVNVNVGAINILPNIGEFCFQGIVSYAFRTKTSVPVISSVMLVFSRGVRVVQGGNSIMCSEYVDSQVGWTPYRWEHDGYREWECEELPNVKYL